MANHNEVAHHWANRTGRKCRGFNMFYEGRTIYSYGPHFPIARIVEEIEAERETILLTTKGYSISTSKHISYTRRAIDTHRYAVFHVYDVQARTPQSHLANWERMIADARESLDKASRARTRASLYLDSALNSVGNANAYNEAFRLGLNPVTVESLNDAAADIARRAEEMRAQAELERAKASRARALRERETLRAWLNGADVYPPHTRVPYVRVKGDEVETTWGARVPLVDALRAWGAMKYARAHHSAVPRESVGSLGGFSVTEVSPIGMRVGCHFIPFKFAQLAACAAGLA